MNTSEPTFSKNSRPVISMVPSWTETLIEAGANVVARTRFCIHPENQVKSLVSLGGTKTLATDIDEKLRRLFGSEDLQSPPLYQSQNETCEGSVKPQPLVILDREENPKDYFSFFKERGFEIFVSNVTSISAFQSDLTRLLPCFEGTGGGNDGAEVAARLRGFERRISALLKTESEISSLGFAVLQSNLKPGEIENLLKDPSVPIFYFIWKDPWMVVSAETWIGDVFEHCARRKLSSGASKTRYPTLSESEIPEGSMLVFSSEPYPFAKEWKSLLKTEKIAKARGAVLVDGESFSWFGTRSLRFLEQSKRA